MKEFIYYLHSHFSKAISYQNNNNMIYKRKQILLLFPTRSLFISSSSCLKMYLYQLIIECSKTWDRLLRVTRWRILDLSIYIYMNIHDMRSLKILYLYEWVHSIGVIILTSKSISYEYYIYTWNSERRIRKIDKLEHG